MHHAFGHHLRQRYINSSSLFAYLPVNHSYDSVYVRSTDVKRCLMSVESLISRLYPNTYIPIHTVDVSEELLLQSVDHCPSYTVSYNTTNDQFDVLIAADTNYTEVVQRIVSWSGWKSSDFDAANLVMNAYDVYQCSEFVFPPLFDTIDENGTAIEPDFPGRTDYDWLFRPLPHTQAEGGLPFIIDLNNRLTCAQYAPNGPNDPRGTSIGWPIAFEFLTNLRTAATQHMNGGQQSISPALSLYSAHDETLVALWVGMGLLTPASPMNLPDFAASITMELRPPLATATTAVSGVSTDDYVISMKIGAPVGQWLSWTYNMTDVLIPCGTDSNDGSVVMLPNCTIAAFEAYIRSLNGAPGGCCMRVDQFFNEQCDNYTTPTSAMSSDCQLYRKWCPVSSCGVGQYLNEAVVSWSDNTIEDTSQQSCQSLTVISYELSENQRALWLAVGGSVMCGVWIIGLLIYCCMCREKDSGGGYRRSSFESGITGGAGGGGGSGGSACVCRCCGIDCCGSSALNTKINAYDGGGGKDYNNLPSSNSPPLPPITTVPVDG